MRLSLKGSWWQISEGIRADVSYYCTSKSEIPDKKKYLERCTRHSSVQMKVKEEKKDSKSAK